MAGRGVRVSWTSREQGVNTLAGSNRILRRDPTQRQNAMQPARFGMEWKMATSQEHEHEVRKSFDEHMSDLTSDVIRVAAMAGEMVGMATEALLDKELLLVERVVESNRRLEEQNHDIEFRTYALFATQQPMAIDLRTLLTVLRTLHELELTGDLTVSVAKAARRIYPGELPPKVRGLLERMGAQATVQLRVAVDAFADRDESLALALPDMDDVIDDLQKELFRAIFSTATPDEAGLQQAVQIALVGRYYERVADHAVQMGRWVNFMVTGKLPGYEPPTSLHETT
jgi:phosphate transport system protein